MASTQYLLFNYCINTETDYKIDSLIRTTVGASQRQLHKPIFDDHEQIQVLRVQGDKTRGEIDGWMMC